VLGAGKVLENLDFLSEVTIEWKNFSYMLY
jgi:hypothetical protein